MVGRRTVTLLVSALALAVTAPVAAFAAPPHPGPPGPVCALQPASQSVLTEADNGRLICVRQGAVISVMLKVGLSRWPEPIERWSPIMADGRALRALPQPLMAIRGVTLGRFRAVSSGQARLFSNRSMCVPFPGHRFCHSRQAWSVTVAVR